MEVLQISPFFLCQEIHMFYDLSRSIDQCNVFDTSSKPSLTTEEPEIDQLESLLFDTKEILRHLLRLNEFQNAKLHRIQCCTDIFEQVIYLILGTFPVWKRLT